MENPSNKETKKSSISTGMLTGAVLFSALAFVIFGYTQNYQPQNRTLVQFKQIERVEWAPHLTFTNELVAIREPTILVNTFVTQWPALQRWKHPQYLANHPDLAELPGVQIGEVPTYSFLDLKTTLANSSLPGIMRELPYRETNLTGPEFFRLVKDQEQKTIPEKYFYWYGKVGDDLRSDVTPNQHLWKDSSDEYHFGLYVWLSSADVRPPVHYDQDHNFYVHVAGKKRFVLFPPWEWRHMAPFPRTHPQWHKSQWKFDETLAIVEQNIPVNGYEAILNPGEVLYIPPYWWHHVQSITPCVSLASWSNCGVHQPMTLLYKRKLFMDSLTNQTNEQIQAMRAYIVLLIDALYGPEKSPQFYRDIFNSRWAPLKNVFKDIHTFSNEEECGGSVEVAVEHYRKSLQKDIAFAVEQLKIVQGLSVDASLLKDTRAIRDLELMDYIETIAGGNLRPDDQYNFLQNCIHPV